MKPLNQGSISGGIGVENLQGSGLIAGETSRAYQEGKDDDDEDDDDDDDDS